MSDTAIELPKIPRDKDYEDYLCAYMQAGGLFVERSIIHRQKAELLELDIIVTQYSKDSAGQTLVEIKGGKWGAGDIFKIKGWMTYLNLEAGSLIVQSRVDHMDFYASKAKELGITLIDNSDLTSTKQALAGLLRVKPDEAEIETIRFAYLMERKMLSQIKALKKKDIKSGGGLECFKQLDAYWFKANSDSFFSRTHLERITQLCNHYVQHRNISARVCNELAGGKYGEDVGMLSQACFRETFYEAKDSLIQVSLHIEHIARITIMSSVIGHVVSEGSKQDGQVDLYQILSMLSLPRSVESGIREIRNDEFFHLYPHFWQFFTYVFGGFILLDLKDQEYEILSKNTGIPVNHIDKAFKVFDKIFPRAKPWLSQLPNTTILAHTFFSPAIAGLGANYRRLKYVNGKDYDELYKKLTGRHTDYDLNKWNNLAYKRLTTKY